MESNTARNLQFESDLRVIASNSVPEPIVYQAPQSIVTSYGATRSISSTVSTIDVAGSQSGLSSYLPKSGLNGLEDMASIHLHQVYELNDSTRMGSENRYTIKTHDNASIFLATEGSSPRDRMIWGSSRSFFMHLLDRQHQPALVLRRVFGCHCFCFPMMRQSLEVWLHSGVLIGIVQEQFSMSSREFVIESERGEILYKISIPLGNALCMPKEQHFRIMTADQNHQSGTITRQWNTDLNAYTMNIYFADPTMNAKHKSCFLGLGFLLEYMFFQSRTC